MSVGPNGKTLLTLDGFSLNLVLEYFRKTVEKNHVSLKYGNKNGYITVKLMYLCNDISLNSYRGADKSLARPGRKQATAIKL